MPSGADPPPPAVIEDVAKQVPGSVYKARYSKKTDKCSLVPRLAGKVDLY